MTQTYGKTERQKDWKDDLCEKILKEWDDGRQFVSGMNDMYEDIYLMMRGKRPNKNYDWQSDLTLRKAFQVVWTAVAYVTQKVWGQEPVIAVKGFDSKGCWQREKILQKWMQRDKYFITMVLGLLRLMLNGTAIIKKVWNQELVQMDQGQAQTPVWGEQGQMQYEERPVVDTFPLKDEPVDIVLNNKDVVVDWLLRPGQQISEGRFVIHREVVDIDSLDPELYDLKDLEPSTADSTTETEDHARLRQEDQKETPPKSEFYGELEKFERQGLLPVKEKKGKAV